MSTPILTLEQMREQNRRRRERRLEQRREYQRQWRKNNRERINEYSRAYYAADPVKYRNMRGKWSRENKEHRRAYHMKRDNNITLEQFEALFDWQGRVCAADSTHTTSGGHNWHVDHDHKTGYIRGILCCKCNRALGWVSDNPTTLRALADYLETR